MSNVLQEGFEAQAKALDDFGYTSVTADDVRKAHEAWIVGEEPSNIIGMMCVKAFNKYPSIFGTPSVRLGE